MNTPIFDQKDALEMVMFEIAAMSLIDTVTVYPE